MLAGIINALKVTGKKKEECKVVVNGAGSAGVAITKLLLTYGFSNIVMCDKVGILSTETEGLNWMQEKMAVITNPDKETGSLKRCGYFRGRFRPGHRHQGNGGFHEPGRYSLCHGKPGA